MDAFRFDALTRSLTSPASRRAALRGSVAAVVVASLGLGAADEIAAKRKKRKRCKPKCDACKQCRQGACVPKPDFASCGKHKHCVGDACVACAAKGDVCDLANPAACCSATCCANLTGQCRGGEAACCC